MKRWRAEGIRDRVERSSSERFRGEDQKGCQRERLQHLRVIAARTRKRVFLFFFFAFFVDIAVGHRARASRRSDDDVSISAVLDCRRRRRRNLSSERRRAQRSSGYRTHHSIRAREFLCLQYRTYVCYTHTHTHTQREWVLLLRAVKSCYHVFGDEGKTFQNLSFFSFFSFVHLWL